MVLPTTVPFAAWTALALLPLITLAYRKNAPLKAVLKTLCALFFLCAALQSIAHAIVTTTQNPALLPPFYALVPSQAGAALAAAASGLPASRESSATTARAWILALASPSDLVSFEYFVPSAPAVPTVTAAAAAARVDKAAAAEAIAALSGDGVVDVLTTAAAGVANAHADAATTTTATAASAETVPHVAAAGHFRISAASEAAQLLSQSPAVLFPPSSLTQLLAVMFTHAPMHHLIILLGLCFSFIGDVLLLGGSATMFLSGLGAFLIAHVAFSAAHLSRLAALPTTLFTPAGAPVPGLLPLVAVLLATFSLMILWLFFAGSLRKQSPMMVKAVVVYMVVIVGMVFLACSLVLFTPAADTLRPAVGSVVDAVVEGHFVVFDLTPEIGDSTNDDADADASASAGTHALEHDTLTVTSVETKGTDAATGTPVVERTSVTTLRTHPHHATATRAGGAAAGTEETVTVIKTTRAPAEPAQRDTLAEAHKAASERRRLHSGDHSVAAGSANVSHRLGTAPAAALANQKARVQGGANGNAHSWVSVASLWRSLPALSRQAVMTVAAAVLFMISDIFVAREAFVSRSKMNQALGLPLYFGAQLVLAAALKEI